MLLSILILSVDDRKHFLDELLSILSDQIKTHSLENIVSIETFLDNRVNSIGFKRNKLLQECNSEYYCFIDDDDVISKDYLKLIIDALESKPDCLSLNGEITFDGKNPQKFKHSIKYDRYFEEDKIYYRYPNHLNVIKTSIGKQFKFPEINHGEDTSFATAIHESGVLKVEVEIPETIYYYNYVTNKQ